MTPCFRSGVPCITDLEGGDQDRTGGPRGDAARIEQRLAVLARDLVIIGMDFAEGEEAVTIAAEVDECRL